MRRKKVFNEAFIKLSTKRVALSHFLCTTIHTDDYFHRLDNAVCSLLC